MDEARKAAFETTMGALGMPDSDAPHYDEWFAKTLIDAFLAALESAGYVMAPAPDLAELCDLAEDGAHYYHSEYVCDDEGEAKYSAWKAHVEKVRAMFAASTASPSPQPPTEQG